MDQQALVAVGQRQHPAAPRHQTLQPPRARIVAVEREAEVAGAIRRAPCARRLPPPARRQTRVGVQQQQPFAARRRHACRELAARGRARAETTRAPKRAASSAVPSLLPPSTTTTSSAAGDRGQRAPAANPPHSAWGSRPTACSTIVLDRAPGLANLVLRTDGEQTMRDQAELASGPTARRPMRRRLCRCRATRRGRGADDQSAGALRQPGRSARSTTAGIRWRPSSPSCRSWPPR